MASITLFFEEFFECNSPEVGDRFLKAMCLPKETEELLHLYYVERIEQKELAARFSVEERTIRARLEFSRNMCRQKAVGWFSNYFADLIRSEQHPN